MSGSSLDGLDLALCRFETENGDITDWQLLQADTLPFSLKWETRLRNLPIQNALTFAQTNTYFGHYMGELVQEFLAEFPEIQLDFIASHGHTIYHYPERRLSVQIGDGAALAAVTGYPVVCDFRTQDVAIDGEGAPIAPIADKLLLPGYDFYLNLGGIANITCAVGEKHIAFDVGGANQVLNILANQLGKAYDENGELARGGAFNEEVFEVVNELPYFQKSYPKTLDNQWVAQHFFPLYLEANLPVEDKLRTATEQLAFQIAEAIRQILKKEKIPTRPFKMLATGGGAFNTFLIEKIQEYCASIADIEMVVPSAAVVQFKEAVLMALMGLLRVENQVNCLKSVTGARRDTIGGAIYQGWRKQI